MSSVIQLTPLLLPYLLSAVLTLGLTGYGVRQYREDPGQTTLAFTGIVLSVSVWTVARSLELLFVDPLLSRLWLSTLYIGYGGATMSALFLGLAFAGYEQFLTRRTVGAVLVVPLAAVFVAATNASHELLWTGTFVERSGWYGDLVVFDREFQPLFGAYLVYTVTGALGGILLMLRAALASAAIYRRQLVVLSAGASTALGTGLLFALGRQPLVPDFIDLTPFGFAAMGLAAGYAVFRHQLLDIVPVARNTVVESMRDGYVVLDTRDRVVDLNDAAREMFDLDDSVVGRPVAEVSQSCAAVVASHEHGTRAETEVEAGDQQFLVASVSSLSDGERRIGRLLSLQDITEQRRVRRRYRALIENSSDLTLVVDRSGELTYASPAVERITGVSPEAVVGEDALDLVHEGDRPEFEKLFEDLLDRPGDQRRVEYRAFDADGDLIYLEASVWNLLDNPFVEGVVVNAREITSRKEREQRLAETNDRLRRANEQLERFASVISHDLRNPLNVARGRLELARETGDDDQFDAVENSLQRMETIIEDVLTLAREGRSIGETEPVNLRDTARLAWEHVDTDGVELRVEANDTLEADRDRLLRLLENLFRNAVEHGSEATPSRDTDDGDTAPAVTVTVGFDNTLYVEDDGPGIPADERETVFEPGHTTSDSGTGLGLAIVAQIASAHGWEVTATDGSEGGARFEFSGVERA